LPKITKTKVTTGVIWVEVPEAGMSILCGCPEDAVKHLMQRGFIETTEKDGVQFETGPNAILLSDLPIQNGAFCNLSEFPVLQMLYRQGMLLPNHPNNTGMRPLLLGSEGQVKAQMQYIYRGNYGLISKAEIMAAGMSAESAELIMDMKSKFAFGNIRATEELLDSHIVDAAPREIRNGVMICRIGTNIFEFTYEDEIIIVDLNLPQGQKYRSPYPLGFQNISREYFAVIHSGQGDGWDVNRPSMSSILVYQGKIYLIDAGPNVEYSLTALGIGINEIEGIFHTHCHDDHFSGLTTLMRADHRIKYFATPVVRASVFKKLAALMSKDESLISSYFDVFDLDFDTWNDIEGLEVRPFLSPHPVETSVLSFRTFWEGRYLTYSHLADIASFKVMRDMIDAVPAENSFDQSRFEAVRQEYLAKVDLKKIDVGGGMIHGAAEDLLEDTSDKIILSHQSEALTSSQKEIGSSAPFGMADVLIADQSDNMRRIAFEFLRANFPDIEKHHFRTMLNNQIVEFMPGTIILKKRQVNDDIFLILTGNVEQINSEESYYNAISAGGMVGEYSGIHGFQSLYTYRTIGYVIALRLPSKSFSEFIGRTNLGARIEKMHEYREFLNRTWLFGGSISPAVQNRVADQMIRHGYRGANEQVKASQARSIFIVAGGTCQRLVNGQVEQTLIIGDFFGEETILFDKDLTDEYRSGEGAKLFEVPAEAISNIPAVMWKLLEQHEKKTNVIAAETPAELALVV
jgi:hemerythrin